MRWRLMAYILIGVCNSSYSQKGSNGLGFFLGYERFNCPSWNEVMDHYGKADTVTKKFDDIRHYPYAGLHYERKFTEFLYFQVATHFSSTKVKSTSIGGSTIITSQFFGAGINCNWYPVKMLKGMKVTILNPMFLQLGFGASYMRSELNFEGKAVYAEDKKRYSYNQYPLSANAGLGYDLHFGKRFIFQTLLHGRFYPFIELPELNHLVPLVELYGYRTEGLAYSYGLKFSFLYLF